MKACCARIGGTRDYRMTTTLDSVLREGLRAHGDEFRLTLDPRLSGLPDTAHGGSVLAAFQAIAGGVGPQRVRGNYKKRVPLGVPLRLTLAREPDDSAFGLFDATGSLLVEGGVGG